jgi:uncharacterized protein (DUF2235 family)
MKNLIVCCDGTWNTDDQTDGNGLPIPTNVARLYNALDWAAGDQIAYYHPGVGTEPGRLARLWGGATGAGLRSNVKSAYRWLALHYQPGDRIFAFGFSRGAYTARSLAGMITRCGLLDLGQPLQPGETLASCVDAVFDADQDHAPHPLPKDRYFDWPDGAPEPTTPVHFVGVWDTVGSLGIPQDIPILRRFTARELVPFRDNILNPKVSHARHAVALDERRANFMPTLWQVQPSSPSDLKQVWFPGVHSDVGGGYAETGLSDGALLWMIGEAVACGLRVDAAVVAQTRAHPLGPQHASDLGIFAKLRTRIRSAPFVDQAAIDTFHASVLQRNLTPPIDHGLYWHGQTLAVGETVSIDITARKRWNETGVFLLADAVYDFTATGEWTDQTIVSGPDGRSRKPSIRRWIRDAAVYVPAFIQRQLNRADPDNQASVPGSPRFERARLLAHRYDRQWCRRDGVREPTGRYLRDRQRAIGIQGDARWLSLCLRQ